MIQPQPQGDTHTHTRAQREVVAALDVTPNALVLSLGTLIAGLEPSSMAMDSKGQSWRPTIPHDPVMIGRGVLGHWDPSAAWVPRFCCG